MRETKQTIALVALALVGALVAGVGVAAADHGPTDGPDVGHDEIRLENVETGEVYYVSKATGIDGADLPPGEYVATYYDGEEWQSTPVEVGTDGTGNVELSSDGETFETQATSSSVTVAATVGKPDYDDKSYGSNDTVNIWVGATNGSTVIPTPESGVDVTINVTRPDGTVDSFSRTTDADGNVNVSYALAGLPDGRYRVEVYSSGTFGDSVEFVAGPTETAIYPTIADTYEVGTSTNVTLLVTEDSAPVAGATHNVTVRAPDGTTTDRQVTTDADGFATFAFTPSMAGEYDFSAGSVFSGATAGPAVGSTFVNGEDFSTDITPNGTVAIGGEISDGGQLANNTSVTVAVVNTTDYSNPAFAENISTTTDSVGQYLVTWEPASGQTGRFEVRLYDASGTRIATDSPRIHVREPDGAFLPPSVDVDLETEGGYDAVVEPGGSFNITVTITENGSALSGVDIQVGAYYGQGVPVDATTVTTNASGMATYTVTVPETAPDGAEVNLQAAATYNGSTYRAYGDLDVQRFRVEDVRPDYQVETGTSINYSFVATDVATGSGVSGVPTTIAGEIGGLQATLFGADSATTGATGYANHSLAVPDVAGRSLYLGTSAPYEDPSVFPTFQVQNYPLTVRGVDRFEYDSGETVTFNYTADTSASVSALVVVSTYETVDPKVLLATRAAPGESLSFTVPSDVPDDTDYTIEVKAASSAGLAATTEFFDVNATNASTNETTANASVTFANQTSDGTSVTVASATLPEGGFVAVHDASLLDGMPVSSVRGASTYLSAGTHSGVTVALDDPISANQTLIAMPHRDTNGNETYDFVATNGSADGPYTINGSAVTDSAFVNVSNATTTTPTPTSTPIEETVADGPGFGVPAVVGALVVLALLSRRDP